MEGHLMCIHLLPGDHHSLLNLYNRRCAASGGGCRPPLPAHLYCYMLLLLMGLLLRLRVVVPLRDVWLLV